MLMLWVVSTWCHFMLKKFHVLGNLSAITIIPSRVNDSEIINIVNMHASIPIKWHEKYLPCNLAF